MKNAACVEIASEYNCREMALEGVCLLCLEDFILENGVCLEALDYKKNQCMKHNINGLNTYDN